MDAYTGSLCTTLQTSLQAVITAAIRLGWPVTASLSLPLGPSINGFFTFSS